MELDKLKPADRYMVEHARKHGGPAYSAWVELVDGIAPRPAQQTWAEKLVEAVCQRMQLSEPLDQSFAAGVVHAVIEELRLDARVLTAVQREALERAQGHFASLDDTEHLIAIGELLEREP